MNIQETAVSQICYDTYAQFYDGTGQIRYSLLFYQYLQDLLASHPLPASDNQCRRALDIACGTGTFALLLADANWQTTGLDRSVPMLAQARRKAQALNLQVELIQGDMRTLPAWSAPFDLVTCLYDSLNYLPDQQALQDCFTGVAHALCPGGLFIADMNSTFVLEYVWVGDEVYEQSGYIQVQRMRFDPVTQRSTLVLIGMVGDDEQGYVRFQEQHEQFAYQPTSVSALMHAAGLHVEACYDAFTTDAPNPTTHRLVWVARKI